MDIYIVVDIQEQIDRYYEKIGGEENLEEFIRIQWPFTEISDKELNVLKQYYKSKDKNVILKYITQEISDKSDEEITYIIADISSPFNGIDGKQVMQLLFSAIKDKNKILEQYSHMGPEAKTMILNEMNDYDKTNFIMEYTAPRSGNIQISDWLNRMMFEIKDEYCRKQLITFVCTSKIIDVKQFQDNVLEYQKIRNELEQITDEKGRVNFIANLKHNDLKLQFLKQVKSGEDRNTIIQSLSKEVDPRIEPQVQLVQKMIKEFFEDKMRNQLTQEQKEKLEIAFAKTSVLFEELPMSINGRSYNVDDQISISTRHLYNKNKTILFLLHEYGHIFSRQNTKTENYCPNRDIEEGMQDVFSELVVNYYLEKHGQIELNGRKIRMEYPCKAYSGYDNENSWARTMLYPLQKQGKDFIAITEYLLGSKNKFLELTLGKENADKKTRDLFGNPAINVSWKELYEMMPEGFEKEQMGTSVYCRRNNFIPIFIFQKALEGKGVNFFGLRNNETYNCSYIANKYFNGRKLYQISRDEMTKFHDLFTAQKGIGIGEYDRFLNEMINELTEEEVTEYSTEILDSSLGFAKCVGGIGSNLEKMWGLALVEERKKVKKGQSVKESVTKYRMFIKGYMTTLERIDSDSSEFLKDGVKDLKEMYLQQIEECIKNGEQQEIIECLRDEDNASTVDDEILSIFEAYGIKFEELQVMGRVYTAKDIVDSAIRGKIKLDDVQRISVMIEQKESEMGERSNE